MIAKSSEITTPADRKMFSWNTPMSSGEKHILEYTGPGELIMAPAALGDLTAITIDQSTNAVWKIGKDAFLACTTKIVDEFARPKKSMTVTKSLLSYEIYGQGIVWLTSLGAIIERNVSDCLENGAQWTV